MLQRKKKKRLRLITTIITAILLLQPPSSAAAMLAALTAQAVIMCLGVSVSGQTDDSRAYVVLQKQNLVALGSVLGVLLLLMIIMAVCVYKPLSRR